MCRQAALTSASSWVPTAARRQNTHPPGCNSRHQLHMHILSLGAHGTTHTTPTWLSALWPSSSAAWPRPSNTAPAVAGDLSAAASAAAWSAPVAGATLSLCAGFGRRVVLQVHTHTVRGHTHKVGGPPVSSLTMMPHACKVDCHLPRTPSQRTPTRSCAPPTYNSPGNAGCSCGGNHGGRSGRRGGGHLGHLLPQGGV